MFKSISPEVWAFDAEWVPDTRAGRLVYGLPPDMPDEEVMAAMWKEGGATDEEPHPYLKTALCRIVSIATLQRRLKRDGTTEVNLLWLPRDARNLNETDEHHIIETYLQAIGRYKPQLIGYNSHGADLKILVQRGIILGVQASDFCTRPNKPWEGIDYFARGGEGNIDLIDILGSWGRGRPSLNEMAVQAGIPGKIDTDGQMVARMWLEGRTDDIVAYNIFDAITTYLLWLRVAYFAGHLSPANYADEQRLVRELLEQLTGRDETSYMYKYLAEWDRLKALTGQVPAA